MKKITTNWSEFLKTKSPQQAKRIKEYVCSITQKNESLRSSAHVGQIKSKLLQGLIDLFGDSNVKRTWGYTSKEGPPCIAPTKSHDYDAIAISIFGKNASTLRIYRLYAFITCVVIQKIHQGGRNIKPTLYPTPKRIIKPCTFVYRPRITEPLGSTSSSKLLC